MDRLSVSRLAVFLGLKQHLIGPVQQVICTSDSLSIRLSHQNSTLHEDFDVVLLIFFCFSFFLLQRGQDHNMTLAGFKPTLSAWVLQYGLRCQSLHTPLLEERKITNLISHSL